MIGLRRLLSRPKLEEGSLQAIFYYCDHAVTQQMEALTRFMSSTPDNLGRRAVLIRQLKEAQHNLMNVLISIVHDAIPDLENRRDFRGKYPDDVIVDMISGPIWFGAECIAAGSHVANHETESAELRPYALQLCRCITKVRQALREHCFTSRTIYSQKLKDIIQWFDGIWADFEFRYVSLMTTVKTEAQYYQQQDVVVLFCESTLRALRKKYLTHDMIEMMDPVAMFAIPRLAIVCGLVVYPDGPLSTSTSLKEMPAFFRAYKPLLARIKELLNHLTDEEISTLENALCSAEGLGTLDRSRFPAVQPKGDQDRGPARASRPLSNPVGSSTFSTTAEVNARTEEPNQVSSADHPTVTHQRSRSYDLDSRRSNRTIFEPEPQPVMVDDHASPTGDSAEQGVQFPTLSVDYPDLPSNAGGQTAEQGDGDETTGTAASPSVMIATTETDVMKEARVSECHKHASTAKKASHKQKGPAGFASVEDLMHRLFVAISGVADQLQTNYARDLRVILKHVFTVCQSDPESLSTSCGDMCPGADEPCTPEPQSPLLTPQSFTFTATATLPSEARPNWVADADSPVCSSCQENFTWRKRRHHCRICGQVVCSRCSPNSLVMPKFGYQRAVRVCTNCYIQRLGDAARRSSQRFTQSVQVY